MDVRMVVAAVAALAAFGYVQPAFACGGFFCAGGGTPLGNGPQQVTQTAERIIFSKNADDTVTAIVQIMYEGPTDRFGWVLPVVGIPEVDVSSDIAFTVLQDSTNPTFDINTTFEQCGGGFNGGGGGRGGGCGGIGCASYDSAGGDLSANGAPNEGFETEPPAVTVVDSGGVGPYDYVIIQVDPQAADRVQLALDWLEENNFEATTIGPELLQPYLDENYNLLAVRLQKSQDVGAIRPLSLTYDDEHPMIPIKLTAVAANEDMGVLVWVLGPSQAVPMNYKSLELNDALIDWFQPGETYDDVITVAANEASGQGFVTEFAEPGPVWLQGAVFSAREAEAWEEIRTSDWTETPGALMDAMSSRYGRANWDGLDQAIDMSFPTATPEQKVRIGECGVCAFEGEVPADFVPADYIQAVDDFVISPLVATQAMFDSAAYVTRLYTNISPHEMTLDPSFTFNPDLEPVSNQHMAEFFAECAGTWEATVPSGTVVRGSGSLWPLNPTDADLEMPATIRIRQMSETGEGEVVRDNSAAIRDKLAVYEMRQQALRSDEAACGTARLMPDGALLFMALGFIGIRLRRRFLAD